MTNKPLHKTPRVKRRDELSRAWAIGLATAMGLLAGCSPNGGNKDQSSVTATNVTLTQAQLKNIRLFAVAPSRYHKEIDTSGVVDFDNDQATSVLAPFSGPVSRLLVSPGEHVAKGQPLAAVDSPDFAEAVTTYRKAISAAQTLRKLANLDRDLLAHQGVSQREAAQAETDAVGAESDREAALRALVSMNVDPQTIKDVRSNRPLSRVDGFIRSPIAGTVAEKLITPGEFLQAGTTPCFTVADLSRVWVMAQIFGADLGSVSAGDRAQVESGTGTKTLSGTVENISAIVNPDTRSVDVRVAVVNPGDLLKKQMYVRVRLEARHESTGLLVPVSAILRDDENLAFVYVEQRDGSFARQHVTLGYRTGDQYDIPAGVKTGDRVVVDGALFVQFMQSQ